LVSPFNCGRDGAVGDLGSKVSGDVKEEGRPDHSIWVLDYGACRGGREGVRDGWCCELLRREFWHPRWAVNVYAVQYLSKVWWSGRDYGRSHNPEALDNMELDSSQEANIVMEGAVGFDPVFVDQSVCHVAIPNLQERPDENMVITKEGIKSDQSGVHYGFHTDAVEVDDNGAPG
jgi:hypothetical protein